MDKELKAQKDLWDFIKANGCQMFDEEYFVITPKAYTKIELALDSNKLVEADLDRVG